MNISTSLQPGEASITLAGTAYPVRFGMLVMRDFSQLTGRAPSEFGAILSEDYITAFASVVYCALKRYAPGRLPENFDQDAAAELIDAMPQAEAEVVAAAILYAVTTGNALASSFTAQAKARNELATQATSGMITSTSDSGS